MARTDKKLFQMGADDVENIQRSEELYQYLAKHTLMEGVAWVKEKWGVETSLRAMSEFRRDWPTEQVIFRLQGRIAASKRIVEAGGEEVQSLTPTNLKLLEQHITELLATGADQERLAGFVKMFAELSKASVSAAQSKLDAEKFQVEVCGVFLDWFRDDQARAIAEKDAPRADKIAALRKTYFADVDALEQSGKVVIPT